MTQVSRGRLLVGLAATLILLAALVWFLTRPDGEEAGDPGPRDDASVSTSSTGQEAGAQDGRELEAAELEEYALDAVRGPLVGERFYFVLPDRFANGDPGNDTGGVPADEGRAVHGLDPSDISFYHGGDLQGLREQLDYLEGLGVTAIWMTPVMTNQAVQGAGEDVSAGYHGYWVTDFTSVDPHLGSRDDLEALIDDAHGRDMKVFLDIITNHTADVIDYEEGVYDYRPVGQDPYTPTFRSAEDATVKVPEWLNDPERYHNRGNSTFQGESSLMGDFFGLDDLATDQPEVIQGMIDIYTGWVDAGVDGFRIDTVKHVDLPFWQEFAPALLEHARAAGNEDFFMFGEVYDSSPTAMSTYTTSGGLPATLDFGFQAAATDFVKGGPAVRLAQLFEGDDWYTDADSNASTLPTFLGNHDMGRAGHLYAPAALLYGDLLERTKMAHSFMYLTRGQPVVYYGDEQGFVGRGGDKHARQDMMATRVEAWADQDGVDGEPLGDQDHFDTEAPIYRHLAELAALREEHPALSEGAQIVRATPEGSGVFAASRILAADGVEHVVLVNNGVEAEEVTIPTSSPGTTFELLWGSVAGETTTAEDGTLSVTVGPVGEGVAVLRATQPVPAVAEPLAVSLSAPESLKGRAELRAEVGGPGPVPFAQVTFVARAAGQTGDWTVLGTDDAPPYRVFPDPAGLPEGEVDLAVVVKPWQGPVSSAVATTTVAAPPQEQAASTPPAPGQPAQVVAAGTFQAAAGCPQDWDPACAATALTFDEDSGTWGIDLTLPPGAHELKIALGGGWDENYGADGVRDGENITLPATTTGEVRVTYDHADHTITIDEGR